jgi:hypothetical protein
MENVLKCFESSTKPVLHTALITTLIYFKLHVAYLNVHKENSNVIVIAYSE